MKLKKTFWIGLTFFVGFSLTFNYALTAQVECPWVPFLGFMAGVSPGVAFYVHGCMRWGWRWMDEE